MAFKILNTPAAAVRNAGYGRQAELDAGDWDILVAGLNNVHVISGCEVTQHAGGANGTVDISAGLIRIGNTFVWVASGVLAIVSGSSSGSASGGGSGAAADTTTLERFDLVTVDSSGVVARVAGTAAAVPDYPTLAFDSDGIATKVCLAAVIVPVNASTVATNQITDKRVFDKKSASGGWTPTVTLPTYSSGSNTNTRVFATTEDLTGVLTLGDRVRFKDTTLKYGLITAISAYSAGSMTVTLFMDQANGVYTSTSNPTEFYWSHQKSPFGFPMDPLVNWSVTATDSSDRNQASPANGTVYNIGSVSLTVPIGVWDLEWTAMCAGTSTAAQVSLQMQYGLGTANNSLTDSALLAWVSTGGASGTLTFRQPLTRHKRIVLTSSQQYFLNFSTNTANVASLTFYNATYLPAKIIAVCSYL